MKFGAEVDMAQIVIRNIEPAVKALLDRRAKRHGRTLSEEIGTILRYAVKCEERPTEGFGTRIANRFVGIGLSEDIPEWRGRS
jgi:plasmid stability protein